jgi:hypothetical protein
MPTNLVLAYVATWLIHAAYIVFLWRKHRRVLPK